jgi:hypothetical protein
MPIGDSEPFRLFGPDLLRSRSQVWGIFRFARYSRPCEDRLVRDRFLGNAGDEKRQLTANPIQADGGGAV